jgi:hypothetical protein
MSQGKFTFPIGEFLKICEEAQLLLFFARYLPNGRGNMETRSDDIIPSGIKDA